MEVPLILTIRGAIIQKIWSQILLVSIYTAVLVYISNYVWEIIFPQTLVPVLGVVTGLLLVFRTQTSYDRWWEGRKLWSTMTFNIRTLTRCIWLMVKEKDDEKQNENQEEKEKVKDSTIIIEKLTAINTILAFAYATKNYLRGKHSYEKGILKDLINPIPEFAPKGFFEKPKKETPKGLTCCWRNPDASTPEEDGSASNHKIKESSKHDIKAKYEEGFPPNIPLELSYYLASYIEDVRARRLAPDYFSDMKTALNNLVECLGGLERISRTPIPLAYSVHLAHATWLFILALPFQLIGTLNWFTIPAVALAAFALLGILGIGLEIQNPFEDEYNDLPLNEFCNVLHEEILLILGHHMPTPQEWLLSPKNHPFGTSDHIKRFQLPATLLVDLHEDSLRGALKEGAKTILIRRQLYKDKKKEIKKKRKADRKSGTIPAPDAGTEGENEELVP